MSESNEPSGKHPFAYLSNDNQTLQMIFKKIEDLQKLGLKIVPYFDAHLAKYCQVANLVEGNHLVLVVANGSVATQLRFQIGDLLRKFKQDPNLNHITRITYKVRPQSTPFSSEQRRKIPLLSSQAAEQIRQVAMGLEDKELREAMERLAKNTEDLSC